MFTDGRSRRVIFIAHCILNQNAISDGTAVCPAAFREVIQACLDGEAGMVQLPCPELRCLGLDRGNVYGADSPVVVENTRIRGEMGMDGPRRTLTDLVDGVLDQMLEYRRHGFKILGVVGANRSPCCGVETTSDGGREVEGMGVFMEALRRRMEQAGLDIPMAGIKSPEEGAERVKGLLH